MRCYVATPRPFRLSAGDSRSRAPASRPAPSPSAECPTLSTRTPQGRMTWRGNRPPRADFRSTSQIRDSGLVSPRIARRKRPAPGPPMSDPQHSSPPENPAQPVIRQDCAPQSRTASTSAASRGRRRCLGRRPPVRRRSYSWRLARRGRGRSDSWRPNLTGVERLMIMTASARFSPGRAVAAADANRSGAPKPPQAASFGVKNQSRRARQSPRDFCEARSRAHRRSRPAEAGKPHA